jgi:hypothetical protein
VPSDDVLAALEGALGRNGDLEIRHVTEQFSGLERKHLHRLILSGFLIADLGVPLTEHSLVRLAPPGVAGLARGRRLTRG